MSSFVETHDGRTRLAMRNWTGETDTRAATKSSARGSCATSWYSSMTSHAFEGHSARSSPRISARVSTFSAGAGSARMCSRSRTSQSATIDVELRASPSASAATSVADERAVNQAPHLPSRATHCSANVVFPYPAGATSIRTRAFDSSRSANSRGRSTILRLRIPTSETVAVSHSPDRRHVDRRIDPTTLEREHSRPGQRPRVPSVSGGAEPQSDSGAPQTADPLP